MEEELEQPINKKPAQDTTSKGGISGLIIALVVLTLVGAGAGSLFAMQQVEEIQRIATKRANEAPPKPDNTLAYSETSMVSHLEPIITNLASPTGVWLRIEAAMVFNKDKVSDHERLNTEVTQTVLEFVRTVTMPELQGASALAHLRDDLNERVRFKTEGVVEELIIKGLILQ